MGYRKIHLLDQGDFLSCTVATTVLHPDIRKLADIANRVSTEGYAWAIANRDPHKNQQWWETVRDIEEHFSWDRLLVGDPITAKVHHGSLEFGSISGFGGGCHRSIALAIGVVSGRIPYRPFDIRLYCP
jgi:hypothetical protein